MESYDQGDWYEDAAAYYDMVFAAGTDAECDFLAAVQKRHGCGEARRILEPACGSGRLIEALAERGYAVCGFDQSENMLRFAQARLRRKKLQAKLSRAQMQQFDCGTGFDLAHNFVSTFKYLLTEKEARDHLLAVARALRPGGLYVLGFHLSDYTCERRSRERWFAQRGKTRVVCNIQSWPADRRTRIERVRSRLLVQEGKERRKLETCWDFRTYDAAQARRLLRSVPQLSLVGTYDFCYDLARERRLDDDQLDTVLILRREVGAMP